MIRKKKTGELAVNITEKAEKWKEYFEKLLNTEEPKELLKIGNREINEVELEELITEDIKKAMRNKTVPEKVATTCTEDGHKQTTKISTTI